MNEGAGRRPLVLGLGNPLMADDGLGLAALERLRAGWDLPAGVGLVDGGTWGMKLLPMIEEAGAVLLLDAIDAGPRPGHDLIVLARDELPRLLAHKLSPHQIDLPRGAGGGGAARDAAGADSCAGPPARVGSRCPSPSPRRLRTEIGELVAGGGRQSAAWGHRCRGSTRRGPGL